MDICAIVPFIGGFRKITHYIDWVMWVELEVVIIDSPIHYSPLLYPTEYILVER